MQTPDPARRPFITPPPYRQHDHIRTCLVQFSTLQYYISFIYLFAYTGDRGGWSWSQDGDGGGGAGRPLHQLGRLRLHVGHLRPTLPPRLPRRGRGHFCPTKGNQWWGHICSTKGNQKCGHICSTKGNQWWGHICSTKGNQWWGHICSTKGNQ